MSAYGQSTTIEEPFDDVVAKVRGVLAEQGFGVLTEIDVESVMRKKLGEETGRYLILGACNPGLAFRGLTAEPSLGLLLPCNVIVRSPESGATIVEFIDPMMLVNMSGNEALGPVAREAAQRLSDAVLALGQEVSTKA